jgi:hypothetical protein
MNRLVTYEQVPIKGSNCSRSRVHHERGRANIQIKANIR